MTEEEKKEMADQLEEFEGPQSREIGRRLGARRRSECGALLGATSRDRDIMLHDLEVPWRT